MTTASAVLSALFKAMNLCRRDSRESAYYLFAIDGNHYYYVTEMPRYDSDVYELCPTAAYRKMHPMYQAFAGITATQIHRFKESRKYCGCIFLYAAVGQSS